MNEATKRYYDGRIKRTKLRIAQLEAMLDRYEKELEDLEEEYNLKLNDEDMYADDTEHERAYERDIRRGLTL